MPDPEFRPVAAGGEALAQLADVAANALVLAFGRVRLVQGLEYLGLGDAVARAALDAALRREVPGWPGLGVFADVAELAGDTDPPQDDVVRTMRAMDDVDRFFAAVVRGHRGDEPGMGA